jgi:hypothetical protein
MKQLLAWNGGFALLTRGGGLLRSTDGVNWELDSPPGDTPGYIAGAEQLLAFRYDASRTFFSRTASDRSWSVHTLPWFTGSGNTAYWAPRDAAFAGRTWLVSGPSILQSDPVETSPPTITSQPAQVAMEGMSWVTVQPGVIGTSPLHYQWLRDDVPLPGVNAHTLTLPASEFLSHQYMLQASNSIGLATSATIQIVLARTPHLSLDADLRRLRLTGTPGAKYSVSASSGSQASILTDGTIITFPPGYWVWTVGTKVETSSFNGEAFLPLAESPGMPTRFWKADPVP